MSKIAPLIKQAFGTSNAHEAASFLASACNRMKGWEKSQITVEVEAALKGVNFDRTAEQPKAEPKTKTKTIYKDTPETLNRLHIAHRQIEDLKREITALKSLKADPHEIKFLNDRIAVLIREAAEAANQHLKELALARASQQTALDKLTADNEGLNARITRLKSALAAMAEGGDADTAQRQELERRLESAAADLARAQDEKAELKAQLADRSKKLAAAHGELSTVFKRAEDAEQERDKAKRQAEELKGERTKRQAIERRAEDHANTIGGLRASMKNAERHAEEMQRDRNRLKHRVAELEQANATHEDNAQHNYYQCESLSNQLFSVQTELDALKKKHSKYFGLLNRGPTHLALIAAALYGVLMPHAAGAESADLLIGPFIAGIVAFGICDLVTK